MSYLSEILADSPVGVWFLDEASGTTAADQSGNSRQGTYTGSNAKRGAQLVVSEQNAVDLTGGYVTVADDNAWSSSAGASGLLTVEAWFIADTVSASAQMVASKDLEWQLRIESNGRLLWDVNRNGSSTVMTVNPATVLTTGTKYHVVATFDVAAPLVTVYLNGSSIGTSTSVTSTSVNNATTLDIGHRMDGGGSTFDGRIGFVAVYPTALSGARVTAHYNAGLAVILGQAVETDTADVIGALIPQNITQATETDTAGVMGALLVTPIGQATETDTAAAVVLPAVKVLGQATEADTAAVMAVQVILGQAIDTQAASSITHTSSDTPASDLAVFLHAVDADDPTGAAFCAIEDIITFDIEERLSDVGKFTLVVPPDAPCVPYLIGGNAVRCTVNGSVVSIGLIRGIEDHPITGAGNEGLEAYTVTGDTLLGVYDRTCVIPNGGFDAALFGQNRVFSFASPDYDKTALFTSEAVEVIPTGGGGDYNGWEGIPTGFPQVAFVPDPSVYINVQDGDTVNQHPAVPWIAPTSNDRAAASGSWYVICDLYFDAIEGRRQFGIDAFDLRGFVTMDNQGLMFVDGFEVPLTSSLDSTMEAFTIAAEFMFRIGTGRSHRFAFKVTNVEAFTGLDHGLGAGEIVESNPTGLRAVFFDSLPDGQLSARRLYTSPVEPAGPGVTATWDMLAYPTVAPGMTVGQVLRIILREAHFVGCLTGYDVDCTDFLDSAGNDLDIVEYIVTRVGDSIPATLKTWSQIYCDSRMYYGNVLSGSGGGSGGGGTGTGGGTGGTGSGSTGGIPTTGPYPVSYTDFPGITFTEVTSPRFTTAAEHVDSISINDSSGDAAVQDSPSYGGYTLTNFRIRSREGPRSDGSSITLDHGYIEVHAEALDHSDGVQGFGGSGITITNTKILAGGGGATCIFSADSSTGTITLDGDYFGALPGYAAPGHLVRINSDGATGIRVRNCIFEYGVSDSGNVWDASILEWSNNKWRAPGGGLTDYPHP